MRSLLTVGATTAALLATANGAAAEAVSAAQTAPLPRWTDGMAAKGAFGTAGMGLGAVILGGAIRLRDQIPFWLLRSGPLYFVMDMMCRAARCDGHIQDDEIDTIRGHMGRLGVRVGRDRVEAMVRGADPAIRCADLRAVSDRFDREWKRKAFLGVLTVMSADGLVEDEEQAFLVELALGLDLEEREVWEMIDRVGSLIV